MWLKSNYLNVYEHYKSWYIFNDISKWYAFYRASFEFRPTVRGQLPPWLSLVRCTCCCNCDRSNEHGSLKGRSPVEGALGHLSINQWESVKTCSTRGARNRPIQAKNKGNNKIQLKNKNNWACEKIRKISHQKIKQDLHSNDVLKWLGLWKINSLQTKKHL